MGLFAYRYQRLSLLDLGLLSCTLTLTERRWLDVIGMTIIVFSVQYWHQALSARKLPTTRHISAVFGCSHGKILNVRHPLPMIHFCVGGKPDQSGPKSRCNSKQWWWQQPPSSTSIRVSCSSRTRQVFMKNLWKTQKPVLRTCHRVEREFYTEHCQTPGHCVG